MPDSADVDHAIRAYCAELLDASKAEHTTSEIVAAAEGLRDRNALLRITREQAARHLQVTLQKPGLRGMLAAEHYADCRATPGRLALRANGELGKTEEAELEQHIRGCPICQAIALRTARADRAFTTCLWLANSAIDDLADAEVPSGAHEPTLAQIDEPEPELTALPSGRTVVPSEPAAGAPPLDVAAAAPSRAADAVEPVTELEQPPAESIRPAAEAVAIAGEQTPAEETAVLPAAVPLHAAPGAAIGRPRPRRRTAVLAGACALGAGAIVALVLLLHGHSTSSPVSSVQSSVPVSTAPPSTIAKASTKPPAKHHPAAHHRASHKAPAARPGTASAASAPATVTPVINTPTSSPVTQAAPVSSPAPSTPPPSSSGSDSSGSGPATLVQQGSSLPAQSAPTQGIGSGKH